MAYPTFEFYLSIRQPFMQKLFKHLSDHNFFLEMLLDRSVTDTCKMLAKILTDHTNRYGPVTGSQMPNFIIFLKIFKVLKNSWKGFAFFAPAPLQPPPRPPMITIYDVVLDYYIVSIDFHVFLLICVLFFFHVWHV